MNDNNEIPKKGICCDSSYSQTKKLLEYQGHNIETGELIFNSYIYSETLWLNNIGEYLAIVKSIWYIVHNQLDLEVLSDSNVAINWINRKKVSTSIDNPKMLKLIKAAEDYINYVDGYIGLPKVIKWNTKEHGQILSDFNRK